MVTKIMKELVRRNPAVPWGEVDDSIWGATTQVGDQGTTMGRTVVFTAGLPETVPGFSVDRMCAGGMTCQAIGSSFIKSGVADIIIAGGMGSRAQELFVGKGIHVVTGASSEAPEKVVAEYLRGELTTGANVCDH